MKPVAIVCFNARLGKGKAVELRALLDSGGAGTLITEAASKKLRTKTSNLKPVTWTTPAGEVTTNKSVKSKLILSELHEDRVIEWDFHVASSLGAYDMIIGRDLLGFLGIDIKFSNQTIVWDHAEMPFKDADADLSQFHVDEPQHVTEAPTD